MKHSFLYNMVGGITILLSLTLSGCNLDEKFYSEVTPSTFITTSDNAYAVLARPFTHWQWYVTKDRWYLQELTTDEMINPKRGSDWYDGGIYYRLHYHTWTADDSNITETYDGTTGGIAYCLEAIDDISKANYSSIGLTDEDKADNVQQLKSLMAWFYMRGLDYFGGMPLYTSNNDALKARSTDKETFTFIESLLKDAIPKLKAKETLGDTEYGYIKRAAAAAMLAELYFNAGSYINEDHFDECATLCQSIINGEYGKYQLDENWYGPHTFDNDVSKEIIWSVPSQNSKTEWNWYYKYFFPKQAWKYFGSEGNCYNGMCLTPSYKPTGELYTEFKLGNPMAKFDSTDVRKKPYRYLGKKKYEGMFLMGELINPNNPSMKCLGAKEYNGKLLTIVDKVARFSEVGSGKKYASVNDLTSTMADAEENSGVRLVKAPEPTEDDISYRFNPDCPVIRLAEIYYMLAECKLRKGDKKGAAELIESVRKRNFSNGVDPNPVTEANLDEYRMLDEWMIEFLGEGRRRTDLIRWKAFVTENWWDHTPSNDTNKNRFPIPNTAISANNLLEQNPGY
jgi:hypothetical protein